MMLEVAVQLFGLRGFMRFQLVSMLGCLQYVDDT